MSQSMQTLDLSSARDKHNMTLKQKKSDNQLEPFLTESTINPVSDKSAKGKIRFDIDSEEEQVV